MTPPPSSGHTPTLLAGTLEYWLDICQRVIALCDAEEGWCKVHGEPVPAWVAVRRQQYREEAERRTAAEHRAEGDGHD